jgi:2-aminoethylphosphonate-pyruvate transaminase
MTEPAANFGWKDKALFTPGPLTTSRTVKQAMLRDLGSRDHEFLAIVRAIRGELLEIGGVTPAEYTAIPLQGSGTFGIEAVLSSAVPSDGKVVIATNGAYGARMAHIAKVLRIPVVVVEHAEGTAVDPERVAKALAGERDVRLVAVVHCETTTGILNPVAAIGKLAAQHHCRYFVDAMSSFGAVPLGLADHHIDYLVSSANKCIEGVPGFSFVLARKAALLETEGWARSVSFDLLAQHKGLEANGQFRFTPPTHALLAFHQALLELEMEGGVAGRAARYRQNYETLVEGMRAIGFKEYLRPEDQGYIITSFRFPEHAAFHFDDFYSRLSQRGFVIYPGKVTDADCFRIGNIGRIFPEDVRGLLAGIREVLCEMGVELS